MLQIQLRLVADPYITSVRAVKYKEAMMLVILCGIR